MKKFSIRKFVGLDEVYGIVSGAVESCFDDEGNYMPGVKDFAIRQAIVRGYTNAMLSEDVQTLYEQMYSMTWYERVLNEANHAQIEAILLAIDDGIDYRVNKELYNVKRELDAANALMQLLSTQLNELVLGIEVFNSEELKALAEELKRSSGIVNAGIDDIRAFADGLKG